jgi:hypothetical protein
VPALKQYFYPYLNREFFEELTVHVTCDQNLLNWTKTPDTVISFSGVRPPIEHPSIIGPYACLYKIGKNVFFEYRDIENGIGWEVLRGENVLSRSFGKNTAHYVGQYRASRVGDKPYLSRRTLVLVVPTLDRMSIAEIREVLKYYDAMLECPQAMDIEIFQSFYQSEATRHVSIPSLEAIKYGAPNIPERKGKRVYYFRDKGKPLTRTLNIINGINSIYYNNNEEIGKPVDTH